MESILKNKYYLYMTEFFAGMSVMAVELGAEEVRIRTRIRTNYI